MGALKSGDEEAFAQENSDLINKGLKRLQELGEEFDEQS